ncbi:hypothetical protein [Saccharothrix texasensis]|uniref:hypothetical protein n=1 Tax=Saccharothrix texasensis TaxID=103734 RepID=UPI0014775535|nr:hypothetical protein [Saccharothrix texasensis]
MNGSRPDLAADADPTVPRAVRAAPAGDEFRGPPPRWNPSSCAAPPVLYYGDRLRG